MRTTASTAIALLFVLALVGPASADVAVPGQTIIEVRCKLEFGPYEDYAARRYEVAEGDTLEKISEAKLGRADRWREITAINDGIDHKALKVGQVLWLPAAKSKPPTERAEREALAAPKAWWQFYGAPGGGNFGGSIERIAHGDMVPHHHYYTGVIAVRSDQIAAFEKDVNGREDPRRGLGAILDAWKQKPGFAINAMALPGRDSVSDASPTRRRVETWRVTKIEGNEIGLRNVDAQNFDQHGDKVRHLGGLFGMNGLLLALGFIAFAGIVALARRRKASATSA